MAQVGFNTLWTMIRLIGPDAHKMLPMMRCSTTAVPDVSKGESSGSPTYDRDPGVRVMAKTPTYAAQAPLLAPPGFVRGWQSQTVTGGIMSEQSGFHVDHLHGIITFPEPLGSIATNGLNRWGNNFQAFTLDGQLQVTFAAESRETDGYQDFYVSAFTLDASGNVEDYDVATAPAGADGADVIIREFPELLELRTSIFGFGSTPASNNATSIDAQAQILAAAILGTKGACRVRKFVGLQQIDCDGCVSSVTWDLVALDYSRPISNAHLRRWAIARAKKNSNG